MSFFVAILGLALLVLVHEAGHFFAAKAVGMRPRKFYLGFGPAIVKTTRGGVEYGIGSVPLGGYVKLPGMHRPSPGDLKASLPPSKQEELGDRFDALDAALERGDDEDARRELAQLEPDLGTTRGYQEMDGSLAPDAYWRQKTWRRVVVIGAGPATNIAFALVLFAVLYMLSTSVATRKVDSVISKTAAAAAGLQAGDRILSVAGHRVVPADIPKRINATHGTPFRLVVVRDGKRVVLGPLRAKRDQGAYRIGFRIAAAHGPGESPPAAAWSSVRLVGSVTKDTVVSVAGLVRGQGTQNISSSVGIVNAESSAYKQSAEDFLAVLGFISLALALLNLLPFLPLDGGHIVMALVEWARGRVYPQSVYARFSAVGISVFVILMYFGLRNDLTGG
jgi:regulator of sigma E protease